LRIDAHHHLWRYTTEEYSWIDDRMSVLQRDFTPTDLASEMAASGVYSSVAVQARQTLEETHWLLALAAKYSFIQGVTGWAPITSESFPETLETLQANPLLKGLRHVVQAEPDGFLEADAFNRGIDAISRTNLIYEVLIFARQLPEAIRFVDRHPNQVFVLDHIAKPDIANNGFASWEPAFRELAKRQNVCCKLSGMVTEADWQTWTPELLAPYFETVLETFGPSRLMIGSDWPVINVACSYTRWWQVITQWLAPLAAGEREQIEGKTAARVYRLAPDPQSSQGNL